MQSTAVRCQFPDRPNGRITRGQARGAGNDRLTPIHDTQQQAIGRVRGIAINQQSDMFAQRRNGQIRERNSYDGDPFSPKGLTWKRASRAGPSALPMQAREPTIRIGARTSG